jgi:hypothetical protein
MKNISEKMENFLKAIDELGYEEEYKDENNVENMLNIVNLYKEIFEDFVWNPGRVIWAESSEEAENVRNVLSKFWSSLAEEEKIFEEMLSGGFSGIVANYMGDYVERLKLVKPMVITIDPEDYKFGSFYSEAIQAWLFGAGRAAVGLCGSILEEVFFTELSKSNRQIALSFNFTGESVTGLQSVTLQKLINLAKEDGLVSNKDAILAHDIRRLRNDVLHELKAVNDLTTLEAIDNTRKVIESILHP